jgi:perosamine synthetase
MIPHSKPTIEEEDIKEVVDSLKAKKLATGEITKIFINNLKEFFNAEKVFLTPSGTSAITTSLRIINLNKGDEVIIPAYSCENIAKAVIAANATPITVDINEYDYNISYEDALRKINQKTKAIILPHMFGNPIQDIAKFKTLGVTIIEDVVQSVGGSLKGKKLGTFTEISMCSFYATKMITAGSGGAIIINSGSKLNKINEKIPEFKMPDFQSALGLSQLNKVHKLIEKRREIAKKYIGELKELKNIKLPKYNKENLFYRFIIEKKGRKEITEIIKKYDASGIKAEQYTENVIDYLTLDQNNFPNTKKAREHVISIPIYPSLTEEEINHIIKTTKKIFGEVE